MEHLRAVRSRPGLLVSLALVALACASEPPPPPPPEVTLGNGEANWIIVEGVTRTGPIFTFREVTIAGNGWLVMHPFKDGKPNGRVYVGATYVPAGTSNDVSVTIDTDPPAGEKFVVMLHRDVDEDQIFDFVFVDAYNVEDEAVLEGNRMIAHTIAAPE